MVDALIDVIDSTVDGETRSAAIWGLGFHKSEKAFTKLISLCNDAGESERARKAARSALPEHLRPQAEPVPSDGNVSVKPAELWQQVLQPRDAKLRQSAFEEIVLMLESQQNAQITVALDALLKSAEAPIDRQHLVPRLEALLTSEEATIRALAIPAWVLAHAEPNAERLARLSEDSSLAVRIAAMRSLIGMDGNAENEITQNAIRSLLSKELEGKTDPDPIKSTLHSIWGVPTPKDVDQRIVELTYNGEYRKDAVYYALSTRPQIRPAVASRLIELAKTSERHRGRVIWGMTHHLVADDAREMVMTYLKQVQETTAEGSYDHRNAVYGLASLERQAE